MRLWTASKRRPSPEFISDGTDLGIRRAWLWTMVEKSEPGFSAVRVAQSSGWYCGYPMRGAKGGPVFLSDLETLRCGNSEELSALFHSKMKDFSRAQDIFSDSPPLDL